MVIILCFALSISSNSHSPIIFSSPKRSKIPSQNPNPNLVKSLLHSPTFSKIANWVSMEATSINGLDKWRSDFSRAFMYYLDRSAIHIVGRWIGTLAIVTIYVLRVYLVQGFYIVSYGLGIYVLNLLIGFLSPMVDPEIEALDGASLPTRGTDEFKPFIRRLPEFKLWYSITKAFCVAFVMTFFSIFDIPVFWPILLFYWTVLFVLTMKRQILHMIKYKYIPISVGKQRYGGKKSSSASSSSLKDRSSTS